MRGAIGRVQSLRRSAIAGIVGWIVVLPATLWVYDRHNTSQLLELTGHEVPAGADLSSVRAFLDRQSAVVHFDESRHRAVGVMLQAPIDRWLLDRQVKLIFEMDDQERLVQVLARVDYTFL